MQKLALVGQNDDNGNGATRGLLGSLGLQWHLILHVPSL